MSKAEAKHQQTQHQRPDQQGKKGTSIASPQGERIEQFEALARHSSQTLEPAQLASMVETRPRMVAQRRVADMIHNSPRQAAQRKVAEGFHNGPYPAVQRKTPDGELADEAPKEGTGQSLRTEVAKREEAPAKPNNTGLPDKLKSGIESLSGVSMDNVKVHYNSPQPARLNALAYAQGTDVHVAPGHEQHLPHEAWHVVQQAQGRVRPTMQMKGEVPVNDDKSLEHEADAMGAKALQMALRQKARPDRVATRPDPIQRVAPGQEQHLPREAWHVVQQAQDRVQPTVQMKDGAQLNDDAELEHEADIMGAQATYRASLQQKTIPNLVRPVAQLNKGSQERVNEYIKRGARLLGSSIGLLRPYIGDLEGDLKFIAGVVKGGFHWASVTQLLSSINKKMSLRDNPTLHASIGEYMQNVLSNKKDYASILNELITYREGRISELEGMRGELATCAQLINSGRRVVSMGQIYSITGEDVQSQEVDVTVEHNGRRYFVEVAATLSMLNKKLSEGGAQLRGYQALERSTQNSRFAYSCPNLPLQKISPELIGKLRVANACLSVKGDFYEPDELEQKIKELSTSRRDEKSVKHGNQGFGKYETRKRDQTKKSNRGYRKARLGDRGSKPTSKDLLREEWMAFVKEDYEEHYGDEDYDEDYDE